MVETKAFQKYEVHLIDGTVLDFYEELGKERLIEWFSTPSESKFPYVYDGGILGSVVYVHRGSILYICESDIDCVETYSFERPRESK